MLGALYMTREVERPTEVTIGVGRFKCRLMSRTPRVNWRYRMQAPECGLRRISKNNYHITRESRQESALRCSSRLSVSSGAVRATIRALIGIRGRVEVGHETVAVLAPVFFLVQPVVLVKYLKERT